MAAEMVDFAIVLIGMTCFASIIAGRRLFLGADVRSNDTVLSADSVIRRRQFTRFMHINLTVAGTAIAIVLLSQAPRVDPNLSVSAEPLHIASVD